MHELREGRGPSYQSANSSHLSTHRKSLNARGMAFFKLQKLTMAPRRIFASRVLLFKNRSFGYIYTAPPHPPKNHSIPTPHPISPRAAQGSPLWALLFLARKPSAVAGFCSRGLHQVSRDRRVNLGLAAGGEPALAPEICVPVSVRRRPV